MPYWTGSEDSVVCTPIEPVNSVVRTSELDELVASITPYWTSSEDSVVCAS